MAVSMLGGEAAVLTVLAVIAWWRWQNKLNGAFATVACAAAWWLWCQAFEALTPDAALRHRIVQVSFLGIVTLPTAYLTLAVRLAGIASSINWRSGLALGFVPLATLVTILTNDRHRLFFAESHVGPLVPGPAYWVHVAYSFAAFVVALSILGWTAASGQRGFSWRLTSIFFATGLPPLVSVFDLATPGPLSVIDPTASALFISVVMIFVAARALEPLEGLPGERASAFALSPEALLVLDGDQRVTAHSDRAAEVLRRQGPAILGQSLDSLVPGAEALLASSPRTTAQIKVTGEMADRILGLKVSNLDIPGTSRGGRVVALRDETARESELTAARVEYRELFDDHPQAILVHDPITLKIVSANRMAGTYYGWPMDQLLQRSVAELWAEEDEAGLAFYKKSSRLVTSKRQGIHRRDDGRKLEVEFRSRPASFAGVAATVFIVEDVTEQREAARTTARLNAFVTTTAALWRSTVDAIQAPLLILDAADRVFDLNLAAAQHLGVRVGDAIGLPFSGFCQQEPCLTALTLAQESRRLDSPTERHIDNLPEGRSCLVRCSTVPDSDDGAGMRVVLLLQDTTHLVQLQRKMDNDAAFATLGAIVAAVAHDVRGPLASLTVNLDALAVERAGDPSVDAALPSLHRSITRISHLMQALLDYGRPAGETSERGNLFETARSALAAVRDSAAAAGVHVALNGDDVLRPRMDRWRIQQAIENLVFNAVQHSPRDGAVLLEIDRFEKQNVAFARCCVSDSGEGFLPDCLPRIFEPFYSRRRGGTGLGLAIVQRIADQHNGEVRAENRAEGGAAVTLEWPVD